MSSQNRWIATTGGTRGPEYARRFRELAAAGQDVHGEARLAASLLEPGARVLDAGCGTGRVAVRLAADGHRVVGVDLDRSMLAEARREAPHLTWIEGDLAGLDLAAHGHPEPFDLVIAAGNVLVLLTPGTEGAVVERLAAHLRPGGLLLAGFRLVPWTDGEGNEIEPDLDLPGYDALCRDAGLELVARWAGWDRAPFTGGDYAVSLHRRGAGEVEG